MKLWTPPNLEQQFTTQPPFDSDTADKSNGRFGNGRLLILMATLQDVITAQVRVKYPQANEDAIQQAQQDAVDTWLEYLNAVSPAAPVHLTVENLTRRTYHFSTEFYYLAEYYARGLCEHTPYFVEQHAAHLLEDILLRMPLSHTLPLRITYRLVTRQLRQGAAITIRAMGVGWRSATLQWHAKPEIQELPPLYWEDYLQTNAALYRSLYRILPQQLTGGKQARELEHLSMLAEAPYFQWDFTWERDITLLNRQMVVSIVLTVILAVLALFGGPLFRWAAWLALLPVLFTWQRNRQRWLQDTLTLRETQLAEKQKETQIQSGEMEYVSTALQSANDALQRQVETLTDIRNATLAMGTTLDQQDLLDNVIDMTVSQLNFDRAIVLVAQRDQQELTFGAISHPATSTDAQFQLEQLAIPLSAASDFRLMQHWVSGRSVQMDDVHALYSDSYGWFFSLLEIDSFFSVPLTVGDDLLAVILVDNHFTHAPFSEEAKGLLEALGANIAIALQNARLYRRTDDRLNKHVQELDMMRQVDIELMEALSWDRVLNMILDWALRLTGAHGASLALVDSEEEVLRIVAGYGLGLPNQEIIGRVVTFKQGIMGRVARTGYPVIVSNVNQDPDYQVFSPETASYLSVPIRRRGRVTAVLNLESMDPNYFTPDHLDFVERLANRASVALDNARLLEETQREREKLSSIVEKTADVIIVVGFDQRLILLNEAAISAFRLDPRKQYAGKYFRDIFEFTPLDELGQRFLDRSDPNFNLVEEIVLDDNRYFHTHTASNAQVGWVIVMHDVTPFKETEQLKNELIATVSHDLKNPLSVINGYVELLGMYNELNDRGEEFMVMIRRSIRNMRQLIDDLLDLAHIDAGLEIKPEPVAIYPIIQESVTGLKNLADEKQQQVIITVPEDLPTISGDEKRLRQILTNLVSNAIKYTPPEGDIFIAAEQRDAMVLVSVKDNGLGISPEDQAQIFERFFRVRRPETDGIEGTGLGLAIVKSLVEAHGGEMGITSHLGEGSTFYFSIPVSSIQYDIEGHTEPMPHAE